jgi:hypothetical protein
MFTMLNQQIKWDEYSSRFSVVAVAVMVPKPSCLEKNSNSDANKTSTKLSFVLVSFEVKDLFAVFCKVV